MTKVNLWHLQATCKRQQGKENTLFPVSAVERARTGELPLLRAMQEDDYCHAIVMLEMNLINRMTVNIHCNAL